MSLRAIVADPRRTRGEAAIEEIRRQAVALDLGAPLAVRINARARRVGLRIDAAKRTVELVLPRGVAPGVGLRFVAAKRDWVAARLAALPRPAPFVEGAIVPVMDVPHRIRRELDPRAPLAAIGGGEIRVRCEPAHLPRRVRAHLMALAGEELARRARPLAMQIGRKAARIGVRDTKSRWGSCSGNGNLSFCWRLILTPEPVIDYVVAHEVAHLVELNHGRRFWRLLAGLVPDVEAPQAWLKQHRARLLAYG